MPELAISWQRQWQSVGPSAQYLRGLGQSISGTKGSRVEERGSLSFRYQIDVANHAAIMHQALAAALRNLIAQMGCKCPLWG
jgi:hypothetical protein